MAITAAALFGQLFFANTVLAVACCKCSKTISGETAGFEIDTKITSQSDCEDKSFGSPLGTMVTCAITSDCPAVTVPSVTKLEEDLQIKDINTVLGIRIPGLHFSAPPTEVDSEGNIALPWIGEYLKAIYNFSLIALSILGVIVIILQGARVISSAGGEEKKDAYKKIGQVAVGLLIGWGSYLILFSINPLLTTFKPLEIQYITPIDIGQIVDSGTDNGEAADQVTAEEQPAALAAPDSCLPTDQMVKLAGSGVKTGGAASAANTWLQTDTLAALKVADQIAKAKSKNLLVVSAGRTLSKQTSLWERALKKYGDEATARKYVAKPSCKAPHLTGRAIDICLENTPSCGKIEGKYAKSTDADIALLQDIMKQAGFKRYCNEWWHFEYNLSATGRCSP